MSKKSTLATAFTALATAAALTGCAIDPHMRDLNIGPTVPASQTVGKKTCGPGEDANVMYGKGPNGEAVASVTCTPRIRGAEPRFVLPARPFIVPADQIILSTQKPAPAPAQPRRVTPGGGFE